MQNRTLNGLFGRNLFLNLLIAVTVCLAPRAHAKEPVIKDAVLYLENFLFMTNVTIKADVLSLSPGSLKIRLADKNYDYSGNFTIILDKPREHKTSYFGFGAPEKAKFVILNNVLQQATFPLADATIWEKKKNYVVLESAGKEWIHSGGYTIQNSP
jgi:hypothetical protein